MLEFLSQVFLSKLCYGDLTLLENPIFFVPFLGERIVDDVIKNTWEQLENILSYYHPGGLEKIRAAQEISKHMNPSLNRSKSFQVFRDALLGLFS